MSVRRSATRPYSSLELLFDEVAELAADARMRHTRVPRTRIEHDHEGGAHSFVVAVDGAVVASGSATALDTAARRCWEAYTAWHADSADGITRALAASIRIVREERAAEGGR